jgi:hypothetical protein
MVSEAAYKGELRDFDKIRKSLQTLHRPEGLADEL